MSFILRRYGLSTCAEAIIFSCSGQLLQGCKINLNKDSPFKLQISLYKYNTRKSLSRLGEESKLSPSLICPGSPSNTKDS